MDQNKIIELQAGAVDLLKDLISIPSFSREEDQAAGSICRFLAMRGVEHYRIRNNVYARNKFFDHSRPTILLNSHHDTVRPNKAYTMDPFTPLERQGQLFGLGSNDAGGAFVALLAAFLYYYDQEKLKYNLVFAGTAEEEISGHEGIEALLKNESFILACGSKGISFGIVGEPTQMQMAVAEKGLLVLDCVADGKAGHAAREEGENAIYKAMKDVAWFSSYKFPRVSDLLGPIKMSVTVIQTENKAHNVVPSQCSFVVDVRVNELYGFEEILNTVRNHVESSVQPRSLRMRSTAIPIDHPIVKAGLKLGKRYYGSPTTSDKALMPFPALKIGPGDSARSHTADEFIHIHEIKEGIELYIQLLNEILK